MILYNQKDLPVELPDEAAKKIIELGGAKRGWTVKPSLKKPEPEKEPEKELSPEEMFRKEVSATPRKQLIEAALLINPEVKKNLSSEEYIEMIVSAKFPKE